MKKVALLSSFVLAVFMLSATSCQKEVFFKHSSDKISVTVDGFNSFATKAGGEGTIVLQSLDGDPDAPVLTIVGTPIMDEPAVKGAAVTGANFSDLYGQFTMDAFVDAEKRLDGVAVRYSGGKWNLDKDGEGNDYRWAYTAGAGDTNNWQDMAFWAYAPALSDVAGGFARTGETGAQFSFSYAYKKSENTPYTRDLVFAYKKQAYSDANKGKVNLSFNHALAALGAYVDPDQDSDAQILGSSFMGLYGQGNCVVTPSGDGVSFAWTGTGSKVSYTTLFDGSSDALSKDNMHFIVPQVLGEDAKVAITVDKNDVKRDHEYSLAGTEFKAGYRYIYKLGYPTGAILMNGPDFWNAVNELVSSQAKIESVEFKVQSPLSDYPGLPYTMVQDPTSKAKIYAVYDAATKKLIVTTSVDEMFSNVSMEKMFYGYKSRYSEPRDGAFGALKSIDFGPLNTVKTTNMKNTFGWNVTLTSADFNKLDVSNVTTFDHTFFRCSGFQTIDISAWETKSATDMENMFDSSANLKEVKFDPEKFDVSKVRFMHYMFCNCPSLEEIDLTPWKTESLTNTVSMFSGCANLKKVLLNIDTFTTGKVVNMTQMFSGCSTLTQVDVSKFDLTSCTSTKNMFQNCYAIETLDVSNWTTGKVTEMEGMFKECRSLKNLDVSRWTTAKVTTMKEMFSHCTSMPGFDISKFSTESLLNANAMFDNCKSATEIKIDPSKFTCEKVTDMEYMFRSCEKLPSLDFSGVIGSNVTTTHCMFQDCKALGTLDLKKFETAKVTNAAYMFQNCESLNPLQVDNTKFTFDASTTMEHMFDNCCILENVDVSGFKTSNVTTMEFMFYLCQKIDGLNVSGFDTANVTKMNSMFQQCYALQAIDVSRFDTANVTTMNSMFRQCNALQAIDVSRFNTAKVTDMERMFAGCGKIQTLNVANWNTAKVTTMDYMFESCSSLETLDVSHFNTVACTSFTSMFQGCYKLKVIDVSGFNTAAAEYLDHMFNGCYEVETLDTSRWNTAKVKRMDSLFQQCKSLKSVNLLSFNTANTWNMANMFMDCFSLEEIDLSSFNTASVNSNRQGSLGGMFAVSGQSADYISVLRKITLGTNFVIANDAKKKNLMQYTGKDIAAGVIICTDDAWVSIINQPTLTSTGSQINLAKWSHQTL